MRNKILDTFQRHGFDMHEVSEVESFATVLGGDSAAHCVSSVGPQERDDVAQPRTDYHGSAA